MRDYYFAKQISDTFTAAGDGAEYSCEPCGRSLFTLQVSGVGGTPAAWSVSLLGKCHSDDDWDTLITHTQADGNAKIVSTPIKQPVLYILVRVNSLTVAPATAIRVSVLGVN